MSIKKDVAIIVEAPVQFFSIKSTLDRLLRDGKSVDIIVPYLEDYKVVTDAASDILKSYSYKFIYSRDMKNRQYTICLAPYPVINFAQINAKYRMRYGYSILTAKPNPTYYPGHKLWFDAIICHGPQETEMMKAYTEAYNISPMKYDGFTKKKLSGRSTLLYLPTSGDVSSADQTEEIISSLKDDFRIIVRMHAHIAHKQNDEEAARYEKIKKIASEVCDDTTPLTDWLKTADVVLSDYSGSIYEALYSKTPVAIFAKSVKARKLGNILPLHAKLVDEGVIPYSNKIKDLKKLISDATSDTVFKKQQEAREEYFNTEGNGVNELVKIIDAYLRSDVNQERWWLHQNYADEYYRMARTIGEVNSAYESVKQQKDELEKQLLYFKQAKGHKLMSSSYRLYYKLKGLKK